MLRVTEWQLTRRYFDDVADTAHAQIAAAARNQGGRRRYPAALKRAVVMQAEKWRADGGALSVLAAELDIDATMLTKWMRRGQSAAVREQEGGLCRVTVTEERSAQGPGTGRVVVLPGGVRIEGLALEEVTPQLL